MKKINSKFCFLFLIILGAVAFIIFQHNIINSASSAGTLDITVSDAPDPFNPQYESNTVTINNIGNNPCGTVTLSIENTGRFWQWDYLAPSDSIETSWDGKDNNDNFVPAGSYTYTAFCEQQHLSFVNSAASFIIPVAHAYFSDTEIGTITVVYDLNQPPTLLFPIKGFNPYTAPVSSVLDHSGTPLDNSGTFNCNRSGSCDNFVKAFNGEIGSLEFGKNAYPPGYPKDADGTPFFKNKFTQIFQNNITEKYLKYLGSGSEQCFDKNGNIIEKCFLNEAYLNYNGHSGYDYKFGINTPIRVAAKGKLYKADGPDDDLINGHPTAATPWDNFHTFYIDHGNGYTTWYLHANNLNKKIEDAINQNPQKYAEVSPDDNEPVAYTGKYCDGCSAPPHLHFEVRYNGKIVDPYNISQTLWAAVPSNNLSGQIYSPGELRVYDSEGRVTGLVNGEEKNEIPESEYGNGGFIIYNLKNDYRYEIVGTDNGIYGLDIASASENSYIKFEAKDIQIESNEIHQYEIDWDALSGGETGVTLQVDRNNDGIFEKTVTADATLTQEEFNAVPSQSELLPIADTYVRQMLPNKNQGGESFLRVRAAGDNRALIRFDQSELQSLVGFDAIISVYLELDITRNLENWGKQGRNIDVHRLTHDWSEAGATWNCSNDTKPQNNRADCPKNEWEMGKPKRDDLHPWTPSPTDTALITNSTNGIISFDVTKDVQDFLNGTPNYGWIIKKDDENRPGLVEFGSRESTRPAKLIITYN